VQMIVHARGFLTRWLDKAMKYLKQFVPSFGLSIKIRDQSAPGPHFILRY
jgi:hypothetical protein